MKRLIERINSEIPLEISHLLSGGCGIFALTVAKLLEQYAIPYHIWALADPSGASIETRKSNVAAAKNNMHYISEVLPAEHFMMEAEGFVFDALKCFDSIESVRTNCAPEVSGEYTIEELEIAVTKGRWNPLYKHDQDAKLKELLETIFSETLTHHYAV